MRDISFPLLSLSLSLQLNIRRHGKEGKEEDSFLSDDDHVDDDGAWIYSHEETSGKTQKETSIFQRH